MSRKSNVQRYVYRPRPDKRGEVTKPVQHPPRSNEDFDDYYLSGLGMNNITVYEEEVSPEFTGLFDHNGDPLFRYPVKYPIGFRIRDEEELLDIEYQRLTDELEALDALGVLDDTEEGEDT